MACAGLETTLLTTKQIWSWLLLDYNWKPFRSENVVVRQEKPSDTSRESADRDVRQMYGRSNRTGAATGELDRKAYVNNRQGQRGSTGRSDTSVNPKDKTGLSPAVRRTHRFRKRSVHAVRGICCSTHTSTCS